MRCALHFFCFWYTVGVAGTSYTHRRAGASTATAAAAAAGRGARPTRGEAWTSRTLSSSALHAFLFYRVESIEFGVHLDHLLPSIRVTILYRADRFRRSAFYSISPSLSFYSFVAARNVRLIFLPNFSFLQYSQTGHPTFFFRTWTRRRHPQVRYIQPQSTVADL